MIILTKQLKKEIERACVDLCSTLISECLNSDRTYHYTYVTNSIGCDGVEYLKKCADMFGVYVKLSDDGMIKLSVYRFSAINMYKELFRNTSKPIDFSKVEDHSKKYTITKEPFHNKLNERLP